MNKNNTSFKSLLIVILLMIGYQNSWAVKKKTGQSGMTYLAIGMCARENAMGDAGTAISNGINGLWHNPAALSDISFLQVTMNQVNWLVDTRLSGIGMALSLGSWGVVGLDLTYMDWGKIQGTAVVDRSVDPRGFVLTGDIGVKDYAIGFAYARRVSDKFTLGMKIKYAHENLGNAAYAVNEYTDESTGDIIHEMENKEWKMSDWGFDFGTIYEVGWKSLAVGMTLQNLSSDMKYYYDEFQMPTELKIGMYMDLLELINPDHPYLKWNIAVDAVHPVDYTEQVHLGTELVFQDYVALRGGYKFNHDVETLSLGIGVSYAISDIRLSVDYAYTKANYFEDINRFSVYFQLLIPKIKVQQIM